jgi:hypothetical protein
MPSLKPSVHKYNQCRSSHVSVPPLQTPVCTGSPLTSQGKQLTDVGSALVPFVHLRYLDASKNQLTDAGAVSGLRSLIAGNLSDNKITAVPDVRKLGHLQVCVCVCGSVCVCVCVYDCCVRW